MSLSAHVVDYESGIKCFCDKRMESYLAIAFHGKDTKWVDLDMNDHSPQTRNTFAVVPYFLRHTVLANGEGPRTVSLYVRLHTEVRTYTTDALIHAAT